ncbi:MAG TPA: glycoside hydrolase family 15 protein [Nannocystis sp.]|jgi:GH15 family glucan-1,4-alpha-glucosidase
MVARIEDYALIGDCHSAALVSREGSIDWLCLPRFDAPACFAALLGTREHGRWCITPRGRFETTRWYVPGTMVLVTEFRGPAGVCRLIDCMVVEDTHPTLVRTVEGVHGSVDLELELIIRFDYGSIVPWIRRRRDGSLLAIAGPDNLLLHTPVPLRGENLRTCATFTVHAGERVPFTLVWHPSHLDHPPPPTDPAAMVAHTIAWWQAWSSRCTYAGPHRDLVQRSLLTLKALTYAPTGGIVAAPTTSLPELIGGVRNWDYRYCWLRDATFTLYALLGAGYREEASRWREWLIRAVAGTPSQINIMYGLSGERRLTELELPWLPGYAGSRPVRIGNAACAQLQLDVFGEVMDTLHLARRSGLEYSESSWRVQRAMLEYLESAWDQPDEGIWEVRGPRRHFTHSKVMAWVAFDRGIKAVQGFGRPGPVARWRAVRQQIFEQVCRYGYDPELDSFVQSYGSREVDASLLMMSLVGFLPANDPRIVGTVAQIERTLMHGGLLQRYRPAHTADGLPGGEGAFLACSFWLADNYILQGRRADAERLFSKLAGLCNDVGLLSEEYDPVQRRFLGNFPQAFSHIALVNTAINLSRRGSAADDRSHVPGGPRTPGQASG